MSIDPVQLEHVHGAHNYHPLPVTVSHGEGAWVWNEQGDRYLDFLAAYSALNLMRRNSGGTAARPGLAVRNPLGQERPLESRLAAAAD